MCVFWNNYVATLAFVLRHYFCAASSNLCCDLVLLCRNKTSLPCVGIFVVTWKCLSRPCLSVLSLFLCHYLKIPVAVTKPLFSFEVCRNIELFCCNQVGLPSQHHLSRLCFSIMTKNLVFQCRDIHYLAATELLHTVSQQAFPSCNNQCRNRKRFCRDIDSAFYFSLCRNIN